MVQGNSLNGDYFFDCGDISLATGRAIVGAGVTVYATMIAIFARSIYHSSLKRRLVANGQNTGESSFWTIAPIAHPFEVFYIRGVLPQIFSQKDVSFILTLLVCILAALLNIVSTAVANHVVVSNIVIRSSTVPGRLAISTAYEGTYLIANVTSRIRALDNANAPLEQLFDFAPDDSSHWVYVPEQWNNSWHGQCSYSFCPALDLVIYPTDVPTFQNLIPSMGSCLPQWVSDNQTFQRSEWARNYNTSLSNNNTGAFLDSLFTFIFHNPPDDPTGQAGSNASFFNISLANVLGHQIGRDSDGHYVQTAFKSDVHVADCTFNNAYPTEKYRAAGNEDSTIAVQTITDVYRFKVFDASTSRQEVIQPTARQMIRYWQAYMSVKDTLADYPGQRNLSVSRPVVQIRLSIFLAIIGSFVLAFIAVVILHVAEPHDSHGKRLQLPASTLDWIVEAARQLHYGDSQGKMTTSTNFVADHKTLEYSVFLTPEGRLTAHIEPPYQEKPLLPVEYDHLCKMENMTVSHRKICGNCSVAQWSVDQVES